MPFFRTYFNLFYTFTKLRRLFLVIGANGICRSRLGVCKKVCANVQGRTAFARKPSPEEKGAERRRIQLASPGGEAVERSETDEV